MKKLMKVLCLVLVLMVVVAPVASFADTFAGVAGSANAGNFGSLVQTTNELGGAIYTVIKTIAYIVALCMICYVAIQWFIAAPAKKAELKGRLWSLLIGAILLVCGATLLDKVATLGSQVVDKINL